MNLSNFGSNEFFGIIFMFGFYIWLFWIFFNGLGIIKDSLYKK